MDAFLSIKSQRKEHAQLVHFKHAEILQDRLAPAESTLLLLGSKRVISRTLDVTRYTLIQCLTPPWPRWQVWNTDARPLILTPCLLTIVPGTWNPHTAFGTSFMFCKSGSWQLPGKCRCLFTAGKYNINFTHTSSNSTEVLSFSYAKSTHARPCTRVSPPYITFMCHNREKQRGHISEEEDQWSVVGRELWSYFSCFRSRR